MDINGLKAAVVVAAAGYPVVGVMASSKGEAVIHMAPMPVRSVSLLCEFVSVDEIDWLTIGAGGLPVVGSHYLIEGARVGGKACRIVGTVAAS